MKKVTKKLKKIIIFLAIIIFTFSSYGLYKYKINQTAYDTFDAVSLLRFDAIQSFIELKNEMISENLTTLTELNGIDNLLKGLLPNYQYEDEVDSQMTLEKAFILDYFETYADAHQTLKHIYLASEKRGYLSWPHEEESSNNLLNTTWYKLAVAAEGEVVNPSPYWDDEAEEYIVRAVKAVYDDNQELLGVIGIDYTFDKLEDTLSYLQKKAFERLVIFHENGMVLMDSSHTLKTFTFDSIVQRDKQGNFFITLEGKTYLGRLHKVDHTQLMILNLAEYDALITSSEQVERSRIIISVLTFTLAGILILLLFYFVYYSKILRKNIVEKEQFQKALENNIPGIVFRSKAHWPWLMIYMSEGILEMTGYEAHAFLPPEHVYQWRDLVLEEDLDVLDAPIDLVIGNEYNIVYRIKKLSGEIIWVSEVGRVVQGGDGSLYIDGVMLDVTEKINNQQALKKMNIELELTVDALQDKNTTLMEANLENQALYEEMAAAEETLRFNYDELEAYRGQLEEEKLRYQLILKASKEAFWEFNPESRAFVIANIFNWTEVSFKNLDQFLNRVHPEDRHALIWFDDYHDDKYRMMPEVYEVDARIEVKESLYRWHHFMGVVVQNVLGTPTKIVGSLSDVHDSMIQKERIMFYAFHDSATGLYNLDYLLERVSSDLIKYGSDKQILLVAGLLNYGKMVENYGREKTDILLFQLGASLKNVFSHVEDICTLTRGRFAIWLRDLYNKNDVEHAIREIENQVKTYMYHEFLSYGYGFVYSGVMLGEEMYESQNALYFAEVAFDFAEKEAVFSKILWFDKSMQEEKDRAIVVDQHLRNALAKNEIYVVYQPQYDSFDKKTLHGYEALIRWENPELGYVSPGEFIPLAEENGVIVEIGRFVINEAIKTIKAYEAQYQQAIKIAINASFKEIVRDDYVTHLIQQVEKYKISPKNLHIEITETAISEYIDIVINNLNALNDYGFELHMDDFGTGYSSLSQLGKLPVNVLKIDQSFVAKIETDKKMYELTQLIIQMGHGFHLKIIAEGVERIEQYQLLDDMGCDYYQGYGMSKPILKDKVLEEKPKI